MTVRIIDRATHNEWTLLTEDGQIHKKGFPKSKKGGVNIIIGETIFLPKWQLHFSEVKQFINHKGKIKYERDNH